MAKGIKTGGGTKVARGSNISPHMRSAFFEGFKIAARKRGLTLPEYAAELWEEDWKAAAMALGKFLPRDNHVSGSVTVNHQVTSEPVSETAGFLSSVTRKPTTVDHEESVSH